MKLCVGHLNRSDDLIVCGAGFPVADVLADGCFEEDWLLHNDAHL